MTYQTTINRKDREPVAKAPNGTHGPIPAARRFPPVLQVLTASGRETERQLAEFAAQCFRQGKALKEICADLHEYCRALGFDATIGVQEVYSSTMPSFPGQTVISALLMLDLRPLWIASEEGTPRMRYAG